MSAAYMRRCAGKQRKETEQQAIDQRTALCAAKGISTSQMDVYPCDQCLGWHVGGNRKVFNTRARGRGRRGPKRPNRNRRGR